METEKVSVIMTTYNCEKMVSNSIDSVLNQTYNNIELIVVNDGSTDSTETILEKLAKEDSRIVLVNRMVNKGRVFSLNEALSNSTSNYIFINDADDVSHPERVECTMQFLKRRVNNMESWGVVGTASQTIDLVENRSFDYKVKYGSLLSRKVSKWRIYLGMPFIHSSFLYNRAALKEIGGFPREVTSLIDYFALIKIASRRDVYAINKILVDRYINGDNYFLSEKVLANKKNNLIIINNWKKQNFYNSKWFDIIEWAYSKVKEALKKNSRQKKEVSE